MVTEINKLRINGILIFIFLIISILSIYFLHINMQMKLYSETNIEELKTNINKLENSLNSQKNLSQNYSQIYESYYNNYLALEAEVNLIKSNSNSNDKQIIELKSQISKTQIDINNLNADINNIKSQLN